MRTTLLATLVLVAAACGDQVEVDPLGDYTAWARIELRGPAPHHGDGVRVVYVNDAARALDGDRWAEGAVLVKEIYDGDDPVAAALQYVAIMRRCNEPRRIRPYRDGGCEDEGYDWAQSGWLFTEAERPGGAEVHHDWCWSYCHQASPYEGAFLRHWELPPP
jgi:hypothetical protein